TTTTATTILANSPNTVFPSAYPFPVSSKSSQPGVSPALTTGLADLATVVLELLYLTPRRQLAAYLNRKFSTMGKEGMKQFIIKLCKVSLAIVMGEKDCAAQTQQDGAGSGAEAASAGVYPKNWINLNVIAHQIIVSDMIVPLAEVLERKVFVPELYTPLVVSADDEDENESEEDGEEEDGEVKEKEREEKEKALEKEKEKATAKQLWQTFFDMLLRIMASPALEVETFLPQRQRAVWKLAGDLRGAVGAKILTRMWGVVGRVTVDEDEYDGFDDETDAGTDRFVDASEEVANESDEERKKRLDEDAEDRENEARAKDDVEAKTEMSAYQLELIPAIIGPLCELSLSPHDRVRLSAISIFHTMVLAECEAYGNQERIRRLEIQSMDRLFMSENKGDEIARKRLVLESLAMWEREAMELDPMVLRRCREALDSLSKFLELLLQVRSMPPDSEEYKDERIMATLKLMRFIQLIEREVIYIKYVHQLVNLQLESHNYVEAALTLRFHTDLLEWTPDDELDAIAELDFPAQSSFARKEKLHYQMLEYLIQGKAWEMCIAVCKELASEYEHTTYDYCKLADILQKQAELFNNIMKKERYFTEYFRVGFYGNGFPTSARNKQFIYRGLEWEKIGSFVERIQNRHPNAKLLPPNSPPPVTEEQLRSLDGSPNDQYIQVTAVVPEPDREHGALFVNPQVPDVVRSYYECNEINTFGFSRPIIRPQASTSADSVGKPENEFLNLWTEKTILTCEDSFPTILRRSEVVRVQVVELSPIENAVIAMENKNREFLALERKFGGYLSQIKSVQGAGSVNVNPFSMALNGAVDAPVNGGVPMYKKAFLTDEFAEANAQMKVWIDRLREAIDAQVEIIGRCLEIHRRLAPLEMRPLHDTLVRFFRRNFNEEIQRLGEKKITLVNLNRFSRTSKTLSMIKMESMQELLKQSSASMGQPQPFIIQTSASTPLPNGGAVGPQPVSRAFSIRPQPSSGSLSLSSSSYDSVPASPSSPTNPLGRSLTLSSLTGKKRDKKRTSSTSGAGGRIGRSFDSTNIAADAAETMPPPGGFRSGVNAHMSMLASSPPSGMIDPAYVMRPDSPRSLNIRKKPWGGWGKSKTG
ncbi:dedicator of cytokinesis-domain-containing protein, partial [Jimgerdemannia flammicorona]